MDLVHFFEQDIHVEFICWEVFEIKFEQFCIQGNTMLWLRQSFIATDMKLYKKFQTRNYVISEMRIFVLKCHSSIGDNNKELKLLLSHIICIGTKMNSILKCSLLFWSWPYLIWNQMDWKEFLWPSLGNINFYYIKVCGIASANKLIIKVELWWTRG